MTPSSPTRNDERRSRSLMSRARDEYLRLVAFLDHFVRDPSGATAIEYGMIITGIALAILVTTFALGDSIANIFQGLQSEMANKPIGLDR